VSFLGSAGLQTIMDASIPAAEALYLYVGANHRVARILQLTKMDCVLPVLSALPQASQQ
jgi:anti-anti-sigma regulatory factor